MRKFFVLVTAIFYVALGAFILNPSLSHQVARAEGCVAVQGETLYLGQKNGNSCVVAGQGTYDVATACQGEIYMQNHAQTVDGWQSPSGDQSKCVTKFYGAIRKAGTAASAAANDAQNLNGGAGGANSLSCEDLKNNNLISSDGIVNTLCVSDGSGRSSIEVIVEQIANLLILLSVFVFSIMITLAIIQIAVSGGSPAGISAAKKRITLSVTSIALLWLGRLILNITGVTSGSFLGVNLKSGPLSITTFSDILQSFLHLLQYVGGALSVIFLIIGGIRMMTSQGNPQGISQARKILTGGVIAIILLLGTTLIQQAIQWIITGKIGF